MAETGEIRGAPMTKRRIMMCVAVIVVAVACAPVVPPTSGAKIEKGQRFSGQVNGTEDGAVIYTFCPGAMWEGRRGTVVSGQTMAVTRDESGDGDTGEYWSVLAQPAGSAWIEGISHYDQPVEILAGLDVPCTGSGTVIFHQCYGIVACTSGSPDVVDVTFVNTAL